MLAKLDKYIIGNYLKTFAFCILIFSMVSVVIDASQKIDDFLEEKLSMKVIFVDYYMNWIPWINSMLWPLFILITVIFFTSRLANNSETIAMFNSGMSFERIMRPYLICSLIIGGTLLGLNHYLVPLANQKRIAIENKHIYKHNIDSEKDNIHFFTSPNTKVYLKKYYPKDSLARDFFLEKFTDGELSATIYARSANWKGSINKWALKNYTKRTFHGLTETLQKGIQLDTAIGLTPDDILRRDNLKETMTTPELNQFLVRTKERGLGKVRKFEVEKHRRTAEPFTILVLTFIGLAVSIRKIRGGMGINLAIGIVMGAAYILVSRFAVTYAINSSLAPWLGVWIPNFIFALIGIFLIWRAKK